MRNRARAAAGGDEAADGAGARLVDGEEVNGGDGCPEATPSAGEDGVAGGEEGEDAAEKVIEETTEVVFPLRLMR